MPADLGRKRRIPRLLRQCHGTVGHLDGGREVAPGRQRRRQRVEERRILVIGRLAGPACEVDSIGRASSAVIARPARRRRSSSPV